MRSSSAVAATAAGKTDIVQRLRGCGGPLGEAVAAIRAGQNGDAGKALGAVAVVVLDAADEFERLRALALCLIENDPDDIIADGGIVVLDQWRKDARAALGLLEPTVPAVERCPACGTNILLPCDHQERRQMTRQPLNIETTRRQIRNAEAWAREAETSGSPAMAAAWRNVAEMLRDVEGSDSFPKVLE